MCNRKKGRKQEGPGKEGKGREEESMKYEKHDRTYLLANSREHSSAFPSFSTCCRFRVQGVSAFQTLVGISVYLQRRVLLTVIVGSH